MEIWNKTKGFSRKYSNSTKICQQNSFNKPLWLMTTYSSALYFMVQKRGKGVFATVFCYCFCLRNHYFSFGIIRSLFATKGLFQARDSFVNILIFSPFCIFKKNFTSFAQEIALKYQILMLSCSPNGFISLLGSQSRIFVLVTLHFEITQKNYLTNVIHKKKMLLLPYTVLKVLVFVVVCRTKDSVYKRDGTERTWNSKQFLFYQQIDIH